MTRRDYITDSRPQSNDESCTTPLQDSEYRIPPYTSNYNLRDGPYQNRPRTPGIEKPSRRRRRTDHAEGSLGGGDSDDPDDDDYVDGNVGLNA